MWLDAGSWCLIPCLCPIDAQLVSLEHPGLWRYTRDFVAHKPDVFVLLFDNVYSTNFRQWIEGSWSSRVRLWAGEGTESSDEALIGNSWEARVECLAAVSGAGPGKLPALGTGLTLTRVSAIPRAGTAATVDAPRRGLLLTAFGRNPYGEGTLLRFWEQVGDAGAYTVQLPSGMKARTAQPCDLRGQIIGPPLAISESGTLNISARPLAPITLVLLGNQRKVQSCSQCLDRLTALAQPCLSSDRLGAFMEGRKTRSRCHCFASSLVPAQ